MGKSFVRHSTSICLSMFDVYIAVGFCSGAARLMANGVCVCARASGSATCLVH